MKFRQRVAWVLLFLYLVLTMFGVYYCFELSDQYNALALEHTKLHHSESGSTASLWYHLPDVPLFLWVLVLAIPYLQVFFCLYVCTRPDPREAFCLAAVACRNRKMSEEASCCDIL